MPNVGGKPSKITFVTIGGVTFNTSMFEEGLEEAFGMDAKEFNRLWKKRKADPASLKVNEMDKLMKALDYAGAVPFKMDNEKYYRFKSVHIKRASNGVFINFVRYYPDQVTTQLVSDSTAL
jgi:hypothetical protein